MGIVIGIILAALAAVMIRAVRIVGQAEVMLIERVGTFNRIARSGLNFVIPFFERSKTIDVRYFEADVNGVKKVTAASTSRIDLREQVLNFPSQPVITKDNVTIDIDAVLYYRIADPYKAAYSVQNLPYALETLTRTTLRNIVGEMELDQTLASRDAINQRMRETVEEASIGWGVDVTRVELQAIEPPRDIQQSMELVMRAERERRAAVTNAEAYKRAAILESEGQRESQVRKAEGEKEAAILRAQGQAEARLMMAEAEAEAIRRIASALPANEASTYLLGIKYLEALPKLAEGAGTTVFMPSEASGIMSALGGLRAMLSGGAMGTAPRALQATASISPQQASTQQHQQQHAPRPGTPALGAPVQPPGYVTPGTRATAVRSPLDDSGTGSGSR